jgi:endonuclease-8
MPEGPEIRREARRLARALVGAPIERIEYRWPALRARARSLRGASVRSVTSRGKALLIDWSVGLTHYSHNQLYGEWRVVHPAALPRLEIERGASIRVLIATPAHAAILLSATQIDLLDARALAAHPYLARLGPDVLDRSTTVAMVRARLRSPAFARRSLASLFLDQGFLAGLGNYLRSDILHAAGVRPTRRPADLDDRRLGVLAREALALPRRSLATAGITNDRARARALAAQGVTFEALRFRVYGRSGLPCHECGTRIRRVDIAGRGIFYCPRCQAR